MKEALVVNDQGLVVDVKLVDDRHPEVELIFENYEVVGAVITKRVPEGTYTPKWKFDVSEWSEGLTSKPIGALKSNKIAELVSAMETQLHQGFACEIGDTTVHFGFDPVDQEYLKDKAILMTIDSSVTSVDWKVSDGTNYFMTTLTRDDFYKVIREGGAFKESLVRDLMYLKAQVENAETAEEVLAISW